jgi:hypothetical protein
MRVLSIDPGITTGWALIDGPSVTATGTCTTDQMSTTVEVWLKLDPHVVVIEFVLSVTSSKLNQELTKIADVLRRLFPRASYVRPGQWKPVMEHVALDVKGISKHERDAIKMGFWWLRRQATKHDPVATHDSGNRGRRV